MDILTVLLIFLVLIFLLYISTGESNDIQSAHSIDSAPLAQLSVAENFKHMKNQEILNYLSEQQTTVVSHRWGDNDNDEKILKGINFIRNLYKRTNTNKRDISNPKQYLQTTAQSIQTKSASGEIKEGEKTHFNNALKTFNQDLSYTQPNLLLLTALTINYFIKNNLGITCFSQNHPYTATGIPGLINLFLESGQYGGGCVDGLLSRLLLQESLFDHVNALLQEENHSPQKRLSV